LKMLNKKKLTQFLLKARTETYAGSRGKVKSVLKGSTQLEFQEGDWLYRDVYYVGNGIFMGLEVVHYQNDPVWAMTYYGDFRGMMEEEVDNVLRKALSENWQKARTWKKVEWEENEYQYICEPDFKGSIDNLAGLEKILKEGKQIYSFVYAGGAIA